MHDEILRRILELQVQTVELLEGVVIQLATLDADVQAATTVITDLTAEVSSLQSQLAAAGSGVSEADQTALESAIAAGQAVLTPTSTTAPTESTPPPPPPA
jgi:hypothetical protein